MIRRGFITARWLLLVLFAIGLTGPAPAGANQYVVGTCQTVSGTGIGPVPANVSSGRFSAETNCRLGSGGQIGYRLSPTNQGSGQLARHGEWAALEWTMPSGVAMVRTWAETGGTSTNGSGRGFGQAIKPWMLRTIGYGLLGPDLFAARFSVANNQNWFAPGDAPGAHGWYWGNESGGLGTPAQWNDGRPYSLATATGAFSSVFIADWMKSAVGASTERPGLPAVMPTGPYGKFRVEMRCAAADCISEGFTYIQIQRLGFTMVDPRAPHSVTAVPDPGTPGSIGDQVIKGRWVSNGTVPIRWSGADEGTGVSSAGLHLGSSAVGQAVDQSCPGGRPGQVRTSFKPCVVSASGTLGLNLGQTPQGRNPVAACVVDGVSRKTCSSGITVLHDSVAPVIDAPAMELTQAPDGFRLSLDNPDLAAIAAGQKAPQHALGFSVQKRIGTVFETLVPETTIELAGQGSQATISVAGINLAGDGIYRVCARLRDTAGNQAQVLTCTNLTVDDALPETRIVSGPPTLTADPLAVIEFTSDRPDETTYECRFDGAAWQDCPGTSVERTLADGEHHFEVRAILPPGTSGTTPRVDPTPATHAWTVDTRPPDTRIISDPGPLTRGNAGFGFESTEPGHFECSLDQVDWVPCTTPATYTDLKDGIHEFRVRAIDRAGNTDPSPAQYEFLVDRTPPVVEMTERPLPVSGDPDAGFSWTVTDAGMTTSRCRLDGGPWSDWDGCRSPWSLKGLEPGAHTVEIQARDEAGNISETTVISFYVEGPPKPVPPPVRVEVPSRKYCALTGFTIRPTRNGIRASLTASRYSRFVRIQFFRDTPSLRRTLAGSRYRELPRYGPDGPLLTLKRKAIRNARSQYRFPRVNLRTIPAWYRFKGQRMIAVPRVSNEWTRCVVRYRQRLDRLLTDVPRWKKRWGIGTRYRLGRRR